MNEEQLKAEVYEKQLIVIDYLLNHWIISRGVLMVNESKAKMMSIKLNQIEELLFACDMELLKQRRILVQMLKSAETGLEDRENSIKE